MTRKSQAPDPERTGSHLHLCPWEALGARWPNSIAGMCALPDVSAECKPTCKPLCNPPPVQISIMSDMVFTSENWPDPVQITHSVTLYSPYRVALDFCGSGQKARPLFNVTATGCVVGRRGGAALCCEHAQCPRIQTYHCVVVAWAYVDVA